MTRIFGVIGHPIAHSLSPIMHQAAFEALGLDAVYAPFDVPPAQLTRVVRGLDACGIDGFNVTVPHKAGVARLLRGSLDPVSRALGAVNTVVRRNGRLFGHNTDVVGFARALQEMRITVRGGTVVVLGAGGAARAVVWALLRERPLKLILANRTASRAAELAAWARRTIPAARCLEIAPDGLNTPFLKLELVMADLVVNATSLGLKAGDPLPVDVRWIRKACAVVDLVYRAPTTPLVAAARRRGSLATDGLPMLVYQGAESFRLWWNRPAPVDAMRRAVERAVKQRNTS